MHRIRRILQVRLSTILIAIALLSVLFSWVAPRAKNWITQRLLFYRLDVALEARDQSLAAWRTAVTNGDATAEDRYRKEFWNHRDAVQSVLDDLAEVWPR